MTTKEKCAIVFSLIFCSACFFDSCGGMFRASWFSKEANAELVNFYKEIKVGQSQKSVEDVFQNGNFRFLKLSSDKEGVLVSTPLKWGAGNWISIVQVKDNKVIWKRIRTQDEPKNTPEGGPKDEP